MTLRPAAGFTLIELLAASLLILLVVASSAALLIAGSQQTRFEQQTEAAVHLAQAAVNYTRDLSYASITSSASLQTTLRNAFQQAVAGLGPGSSLAITAFSPLSGTASVTGMTIQVSYKVGNEAHAVSATTALGANGINPP